MREHAYGWPPTEKLSDLRCTIERTFVDRQAIDVNTMEAEHDDDSSR
jgi:hypothetical protein